MKGTLPSVPFIAFALRCPVKGFALFALWSGSVRRAVCLFSQSLQKPIKQLTKV
jgi:hypothetical protein